MRRLSTLFLFLLFVSIAKAEDGSQLWLRYQLANEANVSGIECLAAEELKKFHIGKEVKLALNANLPEESYLISDEDGISIQAKDKQGLLYGAYALLRSQYIPSAVHMGQIEKPFFKLRILNHWDNLDGSIERGYAGKSIFWDLDDDQPKAIDSRLITEYARANASIGINGTVLNNVNASPRILSAPYIQKVKEIAAILRPYGIKVYLSINFASSMALGKLKTADPLDKRVQAWWKAKAKEIYSQIPDFGGFLVKANSEGQPGPGDYHRTHAEGANMLADALKPYKGIVMWRCFVYGANHKGEDRVKQAVSEFKPLDGQFRDNVILQTKNGPLDFQPREPYSPVFDQIKQTPNMVELQITQEYLGQSRHLVYLAPMWKEFFQYVSPYSMKGIAGVANIGKDRNWCGHHFSQANWYAYGRLAWNPTLTSTEIANEWLQLTFSKVPGFLDAMTKIMLESREACVDYMMPLGLHHIFKFDHHYGPEPNGFIARYPLEWCPVYYHKANQDSVGFNRSSTGTNATSQYRPEIGKIYDDINTCPENLLLWFHRVPWNYRMKDGSTLWESLQYHYNKGVTWTEDAHNIWHNKMRHYIDQQRWQEVDQRMEHQVQNAREWRDVCLKYFGSFAEKSTTTK